MHDRFMRGMALVAVVCGLLIEVYDAKAVDRHGKHQGMNISTRGEDPIRDCSQIDIDFYGAVTARTEETLAVAGNTLRVSAPQNGGISVQGESRGDFAVKACKAAAAENEGEAERILQQVSVGASGEHLVVNGPAGDRWVVYLVIQAPRTATMEMSALNGPIGVADLAGRLNIRTTNGPISLRDVSGEVDAEAVNGPVSFSGSGGTMRLNAENGPITVDLTGTSWDGGGLQASTRNGPLTLRVPRGFQSGVEVEASNHSPFSCEAAQCKGAVKDWDDRQRRIAFGGEPVVKLATVNGPVTVKSRTAKF
jgi:hypothetical protein